MTELIIKKWVNSLAARIPKVIADIIQLEKIRPLPLRRKTKRLLLPYQVERGLKFAEKAPASIVREALAKVRALEQNKDLQSEDYVQDRFSF